MGSGAGRAEVQPVADATVGGDQWGLADLSEALLQPVVELWLGVAPEFAGAALAGVFALAFLIALWTLFFARAGRTGWLLLAMAAVFPGAIYQHAIFPTSLVLLCMVLAGAMVARSRWAAAGGMGALVGLGYVTGVLLAPVQAAAAWLRTRAFRPALLAGCTTSMSGPASARSWAQASTTASSAAAARMITAGGSGAGSGRPASAGSGSRGPS
jgi:hypothetical protein